MILNHPIKTDRVSIERFMAGDFAELYPLFLDEEVLYYYLPGDLTFADKSQIKKFLLDWDDGESCFLFSCKREGKLLAILTLEDFSLDQGHTEMGIALVNKSYYRQGYAKEIVSAMLDCLFKEVGLHKVYIRYIEGNVASKRLFTGLSFKEEGRFREHVHRADGYLDVNYMGILDREWLL